MSAFDDLSGAKFGKLLVLSRAEDYISQSGKRYTRYNCVCECGNTGLVTRKNLISGHTKSCGCISRMVGRPKKAETKPKPKEKAREFCIYNPRGIDCDKGICSRCGWNPDNTALRKARINKHLRKDGADE